MFSHKLAVASPATPLVETHSTLKYPHRLNFYQTPPLDDVTLEEFESWAIDRLKVLAEIEASFIRNHTVDTMKSIVNTQCAKYLPLNSNSELEVNLDAERRKDIVSHFILRLAFCRSEDLRQRFIKAETTLFRIRFAEEEPKDRIMFLSKQNIGGKPASQEEKQLYKTELMATTSSVKTDADFEKETYYKVRWMKVADLVSTRRVFIKKGYAFVPSSLQSSIIFQQYTERLTQGLEMTARALPALDEDDRLLPIITHLSQGFLAGVSGEFTDGLVGEGGDAITKEMVDDLARKHFPPCMRHLHDSLRRDHHLKHQGRLQYGLFLKVLGLPIEEAVTFWRIAFANKITDDKFNKEYRYNIRHSYGLEGKRANYPARSCQNVITQNRPGAGDTHGCPFRDFSTSNLESYLSSVYGIPSSSPDMEDIMNAVQGNHYQIACTQVFELTHSGVIKGDGLGEGESVSHPNRYAARSRELEKEREEKIRANAEGAQNDQDVPMAVD